MNHHYDIFISYRRDDGAQYARILQLELEKRGYKVFLDYEELTDGVFGDNIKNAIMSSPIFLMILTPLYLERSMEQNSWVREEIEMAIKSGVHFIPVDPDRKFNGIPSGTPPEIASVVNNHQRSVVDFGAALGATVELLSKNRINPHLPHRKGNHKMWQMLSVAIVLVVLAIACYILFFSKSTTVLENESLNYTKTYSEQLLDAAKQGDARAQYYMGLVLENGYGVVANASSAVEWYLKAAEQGYDSAQVNLANCYWEGVGITKNENESMRWFKAAAENGNVDAMAIYGEMLYNQDKKSEGKEWLEKAANKGHQEAKQMIEQGL